MPRSLPRNTEARHRFGTETRFDDVRSSIRDAGDSDELPGTLRRKMNGPALPCASRRPKVAVGYSTAPPVGARGAARPASRFAKFIIALNSRK